MTLYQRCPVMDIKMPCDGARSIFQCLEYWRCTITVTRHFAHGDKHEWIGDAARLEVARDHDSAVARVRIAFQGPCI